MPAVIDDALDILKDTGPDGSAGGYEGLSNHGPMVAETLSALRREGVIIGWIEDHKGDLPPAPPEPSQPISFDNWREALGDIRRVADWISFFDRQLAEHPWRVVLGHWVPRLAPGLASATTHGFIRTAHAVRSIAAEETPQRLHEVGQGLGYWAARYQSLPGHPSLTTAGLLPWEAIRQVEVLSQRRDHALVEDYLGQLNEEPAFADVINLVAVPDDWSGFLSNMTATFAEIYLANAEQPGPHSAVRRTLLVHAVTGSSAVRLMAPHLDHQAVQTLLRYAWQASAGLYAALGDPRGVDTLEPPRESAEDLVDRAVDTGGAHAIKLTEACLREYALNPRQVYLRAAFNMVERARKSR